MKVAVSILLFSVTAFAADVKAFEDNLMRIATATGDARNREIDTLVGQSQFIVTALTRSVAASQAKIVEQYRFLRSDSQTGASSSSSGSTSLVLNPYLADIFGVSFESGSILKTVSGNTINLQIKPAGIFCATKTGDSSSAAPGADCPVEFWKRFGITAAFDKSRSKAPSQLTALQDDFSQLRVHFDLLQPTVKSAQEAVIASMNLQADDATDIGAAFNENPTLMQWRTEARAAIVRAAGAPDAQRKQALEKAWSDALDKLQALLQNDASLQALVPFFTKFAEHNIETNIKAIVLEKLERTNFAAEVSWDRPDVAKANIANGIVTKGQRPPDLITARLIYSQNYRPLILTANAEASWFRQVLPGMHGNFRNWQISAAATFLLKEIPNFGKTTLSFGGLVGDLRQQPLGFDYVVPLVSDPTQTQKVDLAGSIRAFNTRLEFPTAKKGVTIPISFTYTNRTDLNRETDVKGSVGLTLRFDSFFPSEP